jgi:hypothetical protein
LCFFTGVIYLVYRRSRSLGTTLLTPSCEDLLLRLSL